MANFVGLLRAVNLGGSTKVRMTVLREVLTREGFQDVQTLLQSGNIVFRSGPTGSAALERRLEDIIHRGVGLRTDIFVRTREEWRAILLGNPYGAQAESDPSHLVVTFLRTPPPAAAWDSLTSSIRGRERVTGRGREAYVVYPDGIGRSQLTAAFLESRLSTRSTSRNWNTVCKLGALLSD